MALSTELGEALEVGVAQVVKQQFADHRVVCDLGGA